MVKTESSCPDIHSHCPPEPIWAEVNTMWRITVVMLFKFSITLAYPSRHSWSWEPATLFFIGTGSLHHRTKTETKTNMVFLGKLTHGRKWKIKGLGCASPILSSKLLQIHSSPGKSEWRLGEVRYVSVMEFSSLGRKQ
jgi:hypothetical protein